MSDRVPVDLLNPGQVFACVGLMEACEALAGPCTGAFEASPDTTDGAFVLGGPDGAVRTVLNFLRGAEVVALSPDPEVNNTDRWDVPCEVGRTQVSVGTPVSAPATLPCELRGEGGALSLSSWGEDTSAGRDNVKFWAGMGGYPGAALARDALAMLTNASDFAWAAALDDPFALAAPMTSSFRLDLRGSYVPGPTGFSLNEKAHKVDMVGYPLVELLGLVGLEHARPARLRPNDKLAYRYAVPTVPAPLSLMRAALGGGRTGLPIRAFETSLDWPGQEGQARCITGATETEGYHG